MHAFLHGIRDPNETVQLFLQTPCQSMTHLYSLEHLAPFRGLIPRLLPNSILQNVLNMVFSFARGKRCGKSSLLVHSVSQVPRSLHSHVHVHCKTLVQHSACSVHSLSVTGTRQCNMSSAVFQHILRDFEITWDATASGEPTPQVWLALATSMGPDKISRHSFFYRLEVV